MHKMWILFFTLYFIFSTLLLKTIYSKISTKKNNIHVYDAYNVKINTMEGWKGMHFATIFRRFYRNTFRLTNFCVKKQIKLNEMDSIIYVLWL